jgi:hypothetical protein
VKVQEDKRKVVVANCGLIWEWRGQLENIKVEVYRALLCVIEGLEAFGPSTTKPSGSTLKAPKYTQKPG